MVSNEGSSAPAPRGTPAPNIKTTNVNRNPNNNGRYTRNTNPNIFNTNTNAFEGANAELGAVLGLRHEKFKIKSPSFENFLEQVCTHIISNFKDGSDLKPLFRKMIDPTIDFKKRRKPVKPDVSADDVDKDIYREEIKLFVVRQTNLRRNIEKSFGLIWGQCSTQLQATIKGLTAYSDKYDDLDILWLIKELKKSTSGIDSTSDPRLTLHKSLAELYKLKQGESEANDKYLERFQSCINTVELTQGKPIFCIESMVTANDEVIGLTNEERATEEQRSKAILLLEHSDHKRFGGLSQNLQDSASLGRHEYPQSVGAMYEVMVKQKSANNRIRSGVSLTQQHHSIINPNWILLDTCSTDNVFCNENLVSDIHTCNLGEELTVVTNGGFCTYNQVGRCDIFPVEVHFNSNSLANILSFNMISNIPGVHITTNTSIDDSFTVHFGNEDCNTFIFKSCNDGLFYFDTSVIDDTKSNNKNKTIVSNYNNDSYSSSISTNNNLYSKKR